MATIYIPLDLKDVADRLANTKVSYSGKSIFGNYMHVIVFAAMVGYSAGKREDVEAKSRGSEVYDHIFETSKMDGIAFLLALHDYKGAEILRETRDSECWRVIESYAAGGLRLINDWFINQATDIDGVDTLLARMKAKASEYVEKDNSRLSPEPDF